MISPAQEIILTQCSNNSGQEDAIGTWGRRVDSIWSNVQSLAAEVEKRRAEVECHAVEMRPYAVPLGVSAASADPVLDPLSHLDGQQPGALEFGSNTVRIREQHSRATLLASISTSLALAAEARRGNDLQYDYIGYQLAL